MLIKYLSGVASPMEAMALESWREESEDNKAYFQEIWTSWSRDNQYRKPSLQESWLKIKTRVAANAETPSSKTKKFGLSPWLRYAALLLVVLSAGYWWVVTNNKASKEVFVFENQEKSYQLAANATATLDSNSSLSHGLSEKEINHFTLNGGASFDFETPQPDFRLQLATGLHLRDIGTKFSVSGDKRESIITVFSGAVEVWNELEKKIVLKNQILSYSAETKQFLVAERKISLNIEDEKLETLSKQLGTYFNVEVLCSDAKIKKKMITFKADDVSLDEALQIVGATLGINYKVDESGNSITFYP